MYKHFSILFMAPIILQKNLNSKTKYVLLYIKPISPRIQYKIKQRKREACPALSIENRYRQTPREDE